MNVFFVIHDYFMVLRTLCRCCPWLSCSKKKKEPKSVIKVDPHFCKYIFSILTNIKTPFVGWTTVQLIHRHIAQVNPKQNIISVASDSKCKVWVSIIFAQLWLSVKSNLSSQLTKLNLWLQILTKMFLRHGHISGWPCLLRAFFPVNWPN